MTSDIDDQIRREFVAGPIRQPDTLWEIGLRLTLRSDTHIGSAAPAARHAAVSDVDQLVDRDPKTGRPRLRATTLAGLLRHHLADRLGWKPDDEDGDDKDSENKDADGGNGPLRRNLAARLGRGKKGEDPLGVNILFGKIEHRENAERDRGPRAPQRAEDSPVMSVLDVDDAVGTLPPAVDADAHPIGTESSAVRTGNRVNPASGAVEAGKFWQMEVLPAGTSFVVTLRLHLRNNRAEPDHDEAVLLALLTRAVEGLAEEGPGVKLGARAGRGLGAVRAEAFSARRHDLRTPEGWTAYYARRWDTRWEEAEDSLAGYGDGLQGAITAALAEALGEEVRAGYQARLAELPADQRRRAELHLTLAVGERPTAAFLGNGSGAGEDGPPRPGVILLGDLPRRDAQDTDVDRAHRMRPAVTEDGTVQDRPMLGDTALFALFKRIGRRLVRDLGGEPCGAWCRGWWGSEPEQRDEDGSRAPTTARVTLRQAPHIEGGNALSTTRTTIDALFADTVDGRLFTDRAYAGGKSRFVLDVRDADEGVCALLALIVRELATVPFDAIGGGAGVGNGRVTATDARLVRFGPDQADGPDELNLLAVLRDPGHERRAEVQGWLETLRGRLKPEKGEAKGTDTEESTEAVA